MGKVVIFQKPTIDYNGSEEMAVHSDNVSVILPDTEDSFRIYFRQGPIEYVTVINERFLDIVNKLNR